MPTFLPKKTFFKLTPFRRKPFTLFNFAFHRRLKISFSFEYTTTLLSEKAGEGRTGSGSTCEQIFFKILAKNRGPDT